MKKNFLTKVAILTLCFFLVGCGNKTTNEDKTNSDNNTPTVKENITLDNVQSKIEALGITCEKTEVYYQMVGATNGFKLNTKDTRVEIYKFDKSSVAYKKAEKEQKITLDGMDMSFDAKVQNGYAYIIDNDFPKYEEVINILNKLK